MRQLHLKNPEIMIINADTKIAALLKHNAEALDAIISISSRFEKLRNPLLRKLMAGRTSIASASRIGGCSTQDFFNKLRPLGFTAEEGPVIAVTTDNMQAPAFIKDIDPAQMAELDVRPVIASGKDPMNIILQKIKTLQDGQVLKLINSFEPAPLMMLLQRQGFESYTDHIHDNLVLTYFYKKPGPGLAASEQQAATSEGWDEVLQRFSANLQTIDVRQLEMPLPMLTILEALDHLPEGGALFVYHKRIPVFLLTELGERKFSYRVKEIADGDVRMLIFKN